jgi:ankyrin repeat protein
LELRRRLYQAAMSGNVAEVRRLVALGVSVDAKDVNGWTPLLWAAYNGHVEAIRVLAQLGVDITAQTAAGMTALQLSLQKGHHQAAQVLRELEDIARAEQAEAASERAQQAAEQASQGSVVAAEEDARCVSVCSHRANWCHPRPIVCMISLQGSHSRVLCGRWLQHGGDGK